jgi:hypothetical protein
MATGQAPFAGKDTLAVLSALALEQPRPPRELDPELPAALSDLVMRLLAKSAADRPPTAADVADALRALEPLSATDAPPASRHPPAGLGPPAAPASGRPRSRRWPILAAAAALIALASLAGLWLRPRTPAGAPGTAGPGTAPVPLSGDLTVRIWTKDGVGKRGWKVEEPGALPVRNGEWVHLHATLNQPAYVYLLWIDSQGAVTPLYPWHLGADLKDDLTVPPPSRPPVAEVHSPSALTQGWEMDGTSGLDTIVLLARRSPWPAGQPLAGLVGNLKPAPLGHEGEVAVRGFDEGQPTDLLDLGQHRAPKQVAAEIDEPVLQLLARLRGEFPMARAVRFAHKE